MTRYMGIDQSLSKTGVVILEGDKVIHHEVIHTDKTGFTIYHDVLSRSQAIADRITKLKTMYEVDHWAMEGLSFGSNGAATRNLAILFSKVCSTLFEVNPYTVAPMTLKKFATGSGKASKEDMLEEVYVHNPVFGELLKPLSISKGKHDLADAYWIAHYLKEEIIDGNNQDPANKNQPS